MHTHSVHWQEGADDTAHGGIRLEVREQPRLADREHLRNDDIAAMRLSAIGSRQNRRHSDTEDESCDSASTVWMGAFTAFTLHHGWLLRVLVNGRQIDLPVNSPRRRAQVPPHLANAVPQAN